MPFDGGDHYRRNYCPVGRFIPFVWGVADIMEESWGLSAGEDYELVERRHRISDLVVYIHLDKHSFLWNTVCAGSSSGANLGLIAWLVFVFCFGFRWAAWVQSNFVAPFAFHGSAVTRTGLKWDEIFVLSASIVSSGLLWLVTVYRYRNQPERENSSKRMIHSYNALVTLNVRKQMNWAGGKFRRETICSSTCKYIFTETGVILYGNAPRLDDTNKFAEIKLKLIPLCFLFQTCSPVY